MKTCNVCGKEFDEKDLILQNSDDGTEYYVCTECETKGVQVTETVEYHICSQCGYPHQKDEFKGICKFCEQTKSFAKIELTEVEEQMLDVNPQKLYKEKLGDEAAAKIAQWIESPQRKEVGIRHRRDRIIDTSSLIGILVGYILLETTMNNYTSNKVIFLILLAVTVMAIIASPLFKLIDRKPRKKPLPLWLSYVIIALIIDLYVLIAKFIS